MEKHTTDAHVFFKLRALTTIKLKVLNKYNQTCDIGLAHTKKRDLE